jgi:uncharacterized protein YcnI
MKRRTPTIASVAVGAGLLLAVALPLSASAHVTVTPNTAPAGSYALVTFTVPTESTTAVTTKLEVDIPAATPFSSVSYVPVPGWTVQLITETLPKPVKVGENELKHAVTKVIWTAAPGSEIQAGQLQLFPLSLGAVPDTGSIAFHALQSYSDGSVVKWVEKGADAEHPAPVLYVNDTAPNAAHHDDTASLTATPAATPGATPSSSDPVARGLGIGGLVVGAVGVVLAVVTLRRAGSSRS